jgi:hypothetical protein
MTLYEELGVAPDARPDTIRDAYRNLARLLHPDAQTNPALKESAEVQMKRINHLYDILSDPDRRRRYDLELAEPPEQPGAIVLRPSPVPDQLQHLNSGTLAWLAATAICATFIIWLATRETSLPVVYQPSAFAPAAGAVPASSSTPGALAKTTAAILPKSNPDKIRDDEIARLRAELQAAYADRERLAKQLAALETEHRYPPPAPILNQSTVNLTPAPLAAQSPPVEIPLPTILLHAAPPPAPPRLEPAVSNPAKWRWSGSWTYVAARNEGKNKTLIPPEFIETVLREDNGFMRGQYHARFKVPDRGISPDVNFQFEGKVTGVSGRFQWIGSGGAKGEVQLHLVSETAIEVDWAATDLGKTMGLASGTAVLNRKN